MATPAGNSVSNTGDFRIDSLLQGSSWNVPANNVITYSLHNIVPNSIWTTTEIQAVRQAFDAWEAVADIEFVRVGGSPDGFPELTNADIAISFTGFALAEIVDVGTLGLGIFPDPQYADGTFLPALTSVFGFQVTRDDYPNPEGDIFIDDFNFTLWFTTLNPGGQGFHTIVHEIGHALGLSHPNDSGFNSNQLDTVMSYNGISAVLGITEFPDIGHAATPMPHDILAIQHIYGANMSHKTGNNTYFIEHDGVLQTIWDAGGIDTFDGSKVDGVFIDLREGQFSAADVYSWTGIAFNTVIENAIGSSGADILIGNPSNNEIQAGAGDDLLNGIGGNDRLFGGPGDDELKGGAGIDLLNAGNGNDVLRGGGGTDRMFGGNGEDQLLGGGGADRLIGNAGNDELRGQGGTDVLNGAAGSDTYIVLPNDGGVDFYRDTGTGEGDIDVIDTTMAPVLWFAGTFNADITGIERIEGDRSSIEKQGISDANWDFTGIEVIGIKLIRGGDGDDSIRGPDSDDRIVGLDGNDRLWGGPGDDKVFGTAGNDLVIGQAGDDRVHGGGGIDRVFGGLGDDTLIGSSGDDRLVGGPGNDLMNGGGGDDVMLGGGGDDRFIFNPADHTNVNGGPGEDALVFTDSGADLNLLPLDDIPYSNIEIVDLAGTGDNRIRLEPGDVDDFSNGLNAFVFDGTIQLLIMGDAGDSVVSRDDDWAQGPDIEIGGQLYNTWIDEDRGVQLLIDEDIDQFMG